jgi:mannose-1-phosphate guanylyltransferase
MKAMILAAGLGTRLRPLTDDRPKALVEINGQTLLEITLKRLSTFGIREVVINVHHFADMIVAYLKSNNCFGMKIKISREGALLDTGGGLKQAAWFFLQSSPSTNEPFLLHNVDVLSDIDLSRMLQVHSNNRALATLAVQKRDTSRYLLFNQQLELCGRCAGADHKPEIVRPSPNLEPLAFAGIHIISPRLLPMLNEEGSFSIISSYIRLAGAGERILAFRADDSYWRDLGKPDDLIHAGVDLKSGKVQ